MRFKYWKEDILRNTVEEGLITMHPTQYRNDLLCIKESLYTVLLTSVSYALFFFLKKEKTDEINILNRTYAVKAKEEIPQQRHGRFDALHALLIAT